ncbi:helix-turn-helix domain-containing protein [Streptomyces cellulosae]|uniref:Helix-turn-helix transcriptional regulator n=2 Tax=Streptomyces TaxID=1883 RepID=A0ABU3J6K5_9ACTN|nr:helix-turn-helix domain-containing protein [Streptomyces sp. McG7]MCX4481448.1 helix-turn-helix domain-containing protein [Streptomyces cellulosae]MDQ0485453.1 transcriptional regulator with XRE-family HTH domain [Streptomyces thermodiastaticus]MDT6970681.1 helix-turn-helix transcriptional regulator [Streptomyces thermocarboxydus]MDX3416176.1 helix-turn-helix transcriptional regulator [Streptomyces sp. MD20-1-1]MXQ57061.1 helix-turn-helix domain-containing protein [Streptomyces sp. XHT-2]M
MSERRAAPTVGQVVLGRRLHELREAAGLSREEAARILRVAPATVRRMETAEVSLKIPYVQMLLTAYGVPEHEADTFVALAEDANRPGWWQRYHDVLPEWFSLYVSLEGAARIIRSYEPHFVPGLLQTEDYARAVLEAGTIGTAGPETVERHVALRMERQKLLERPDPPHLWVLMEETVLRRPVSGDSRVMRDQLDKLLEFAARDRVTLQIAEFADGPHPGTYAPFSLFRFAEPELPDMVFTEYLTGALYLDSRKEVSVHLEVLDHMTAGAASARRTEKLLLECRERL